MELLDQSHVRVFLSPRVSFSQQEMESLIRFCGLLGQLGTLAYHCCRQSEVRNEKTEGTGFYGTLDGSFTRVRIALPDDFKTPYVLPRLLTKNSDPLVFVSLLQLAAFLLCHEIGHRDAPVNDEKKREKHEWLCDANAIVLMRDLGGDLIQPPIAQKKFQRLVG
jgi:hypothetical protein